jgi:hypothetical protein
MEQLRRKLRPDQTFMAKHHRLFTMSRALAVKARKDKVPSVPLPKLRKEADESVEIAKDFAQTTGALDGPPGEGDRCRVVHLPALGNKQSRVEWPP